MRYISVAGEKGRFPAPSPAGTGTAHTHTALGMQGFHPWSEEDTSLQAGGETDVRAWNLGKQLTLI